MQQEFWQQKWQQTDIGFNQIQTNLLLERYWPQLNCPKKGTVFVPLCGKSIDMIWLLAQGYNIIGVELSEIACRDFFEEQGIHYHIKKQQKFQVFQADNIKLYCGDIFELQKNNVKKVSAIYDRAALVALPSDLRLHYAKLLKNLFPKKIEMLLITSAYDQQQMPGPPFSVSQQEVAMLYQDTYEIVCLYDKKLNTIPEHLAAKGLQTANELAFHLKA